MADDVTPTGDTGAAAPSPTSPGASGAPSVPSGQTASPTGFTYQEDRSQWIPKHRFDQINTQATTHATRNTQLEQQLLAEQRRVQALAGVTPQDPNQAQSDRVKEAFFEMFPNMKHLANMTDAQIQALVQAPQQFQRANDAEGKHWQRHGNQQVSAIAERVAEAMGAETLTPRQTEKLRTTFASWIKSTAQQELQASGGQSSATLQKYEDGDPSVVEAFAKEYIEDFVTPARRHVAAQNINRNRPVPNSSGRSQVTSVARPEKFNSWDERIAYAQNLGKERGMNFGH